jgi:hypothetical protein
MVDKDISKYAALLKKQYLFHGLNEAQLAHVVARFERFDVPAGHIVLEEGSRGASFYFIYQGRVKITRRDGPRQVKLADYGAGEYFGEESLLFDRPRSTSVTTLEATTLLRLDRESFFELINLVPEIRMNLSATAESRYLVRGETFDWLGADEVIYLISRKHELFLLLALLPPIALGLISIPIFVAGFSGTTPFFTNAGIGLGVAAIVLAVLWGIWNWLDWGNDFYIVTNQRVVWLERVIVLYYSRNEAPLTQVLAVNSKSTFWGQLFGYGNVDVRTFTGGILMRNCSKPKLFASFVENFQARAKSEQKHAESAIIDNEMRRRLGMEKPTTDGAASLAPLQSAANQPIRKKVKPGSLEDKLQTFLQLRYERDGVITYRKYWLVLFAKTWKPLLGGLLLTGGYLYVMYLNVFTGRQILSNGPLTILYLLFGFIMLLWWGYNYWDWSDDIYQLTPEQILDIERRPLGDEIKKSAPLDSILSLEHERQGIIQLIFNYGNVVVNVGTTRFIFLGVHNPDEVHKDIADYIETRRRKKAEAQAVQERLRLGEWFSSYRKNTQMMDQRENDLDWDMFPG